MAGTGKKKSKLQSKSTDKEAEKPQPWPDLPQQLIHQIATQPLEIKHICSGGVAKSWRLELASKYCRSNPASPWLELSTSFATDHKQLHIFNIPIKKDFIWYLQRRRPEPSAYNFVGCSHGVILAKGFLLDPVNLYGACGMPLWDSGVPFTRAALSSSPFPWRYNRESGCTVMVLTGVTHPAFAFYRAWREYEWIKKDSTFVDPHCCDPNQRGHLLRFTNGIWFKEKFYALSLQGTLAVIQCINSDLRITALSSRRAVPSVSSMHFREFLVESEGNIWLVFLISRNSIHKVDYVEVYQLDAANLTWIRQCRLGDVTLFMGANCCMSVSASRAGCRGNCVYFSGNGCWSVYEMETGTISSVYSLNESTVWDDME